MDGIRMPRREEKAACAMKTGKVNSVLSAKTSRRAERWRCRLRTSPVSARVT
jgi:hypothetical protein